jgi:ribosome biogenesis GTPase A
MVRVRYSFGSRHTGRIKNIKKQRGKYPDVMKDVVRISDIVLEVLDARYVGEMRNVLVEEDVLAKGKKLVYVLNKCDLVDEKNVKLPKEMRPFVFVSATKGIGLGKLKANIKMEAKRVMKESGRKRIHVGVIGYPNAGKSSVINMIIRRGVAGTGKQAGFTKGMQKIKMSEGILILDTPGVIPDERYSSDVESFAKDVKVGARTYSDVRDPEGAVAFLMKSDGDLIEGFYGVHVDGDIERLIEELGREKGFLGKGGVVDVDRTARLVLRDWQEGRIG